jgi:8-oxo-dGTP pyrophosphatase MutT (NUDIX family)
VSGQQTWDGEPIALEDPRGSTVVVRRRTPDGGVEALLLHRAHHGPDYEGDWAWTSPAGARHPGEPVHAAALRELSEEAGLESYLLAPLDLSGPWARFIAEVPYETDVRLVDPEHDRFEWVSPDEARGRALPTAVSATFGRVETAQTGIATFEPLSEGDLADVVRWQRSPDAAEWFAGSPATVDEARQRYGSRLAGESATRMWVTRVDGVRAGYIQAYRVGAYDEYAEKTQDPDAIGFDYLIGEPAVVGRGWGRVVIWSFMRDVLCAEYPDAPRFLASPDHRNHRSVRVLEACGLTQGRWIDVVAREGEPPSTEIVCTLDRSLWFGFGAR